MRQLYANNAKTTLRVPISATDTSLSLVDGSKFPVPGAYEYFTVTLDIDGVIEILHISSRSGDTLNVGVLSNRGREGTAAHAFPAGTKVECRLTKETLEVYSRAFLPIAGVQSLVAPKDAYNDSYLCNSLDTVGNPTPVIRKDDNTWRSLTYTTISTGTVSTSTTTQVTSSLVSVSGWATGKYLIQFTSGTYAGYIRAITALPAGENRIVWSQAMPGLVTAGTTYEIMKDNASIMREASNVDIGDDAIIMPLILGGY